MGWIVRLVETGGSGRRRSVDVMEIERPGDLGEIGNLGLSLAEGKRLLCNVQGVSSGDPNMRRAGEGSPIAGAISLTVIAGCTVFQS